MVLRRGTRVLQRLDIARQGIRLGTQRVHVHGPGVGFRITAHTANLHRAESHWRRFLAHLPIRVLQWVNLNHACIQFITLQKTSF